MSDEHAWSWTGETQAGRELRLSGAQGRVDEATLDGAPVELIRGSFRGGKLGEGYVVKTAEHGTFTATAPGTDPALHGELLRKFVDAPPTDGWTLVPTSEREVEGEHRFAFEISNDWRTATLEIYLSESVARVWLERGGGRTLQEMARQELANKLRRADWPAVQQQADNGPTQVIFSAHPPDRY